MSSSIYVNGVVMPVNVMYIEYIKNNIGILHSLTSQKVNDKDASGVLLVCLARGPSTRHLDWRFLKWTGKYLLTKLRT